MYVQLQLPLLVVSGQIYSYHGVMGKLSDRFEMRCNAALTDAIDQWRSGQRPIPSRAKAIRLLVSRAIVSENLLGLILFESGRELSAANRIGPDTSAEIYERWAQVIRQSLDRVAHERSTWTGPEQHSSDCPHQAQETPDACIPAPKSSQGIR